VSGATGLIGEFATSPGTSVVIVFVGVMMRFDFDVTSSGGGAVTRTRPVAQPPLYNGDACTGAMFEDTPCNTQSCNPGTSANSS